MIAVQQTSHTRLAYQVELQQLESDLLGMGLRAENMVALAVESLCRQDPALAREVFHRDDEVDALDLQIETRCLRLLALQQPMAGDLRAIGTVLKAITDIERVGDLAVDIARVGLKIEKEFAETDFVDLPKIANIARDMLRLALQALVRRELDLVSEVAKREVEVDRLYREFREQVFANMRDHPEQVVADGWLFLAIHHVERIADHACNIAERVSFLVSGELKHLVA